MFKPKGDEQFEKKKIYLVPIGTGFEKCGLDLEDLRSFCEVYLHMKTALHESVELIEYEKGSDFKARIRMQNQKEHERKLKGRQNFEFRQLLTKDIHSLLSTIKKSLPDARFVVGVTMLDLYPDEKWNFVFGEASPGEGTGIYSFARYGIHKDQLLCRSLKTLVHEILHLCGVEVRNIVVS